MLRMKMIFAVLIVAAVAVPMAHATAYLPTQLFVAGSTAMWQTMALGAYNSGHNFLATGTNPSPNASTCHFVTSGTAPSVNFNLSDTRNSIGVVDSGQTWVVWSVKHTGSNTAQQDCTAAASANDPVVDIWLYANVDSVLGNRCYFAAPSCLLQSPSTFPTAGNAIGSQLWGDGSTDSTPSANVQAFLIAGGRINAGASDIRPEDAAWAECRINSALGNSQQSGLGGTQDGLDGLGYNNPSADQNGTGHSGVCPHYTTAVAQDNINGVGSSILSGYPGSGKAFHVVAFNITGNDPLTNTKVPAYTTYAVGASPIIFVVNNTNGNFTGVTNATERQLQAAFSGTTCSASVFEHGASAAINVFLREPLSGTYNTTEATVMRYPTAYGATGAGVIGASMETGVGTNNPLKNLTCGAGGGARFRGIGTGQEVQSVHDSANASIFNGGANGTAKDGIGFTFFSYGNVSTLADQSGTYAYLQLNGVDPIFASYANQTGQAKDPGQPGGGVVPGVADVPGGLFPACENKIWTGGLSFPNLRNGTYRSWSDIRMMSTGTAGGWVAKLITNSNKYVVTTVPDYVPAIKVTLPAGQTCTASGTFTDPGLGFLRSHYEQKDGAGNLLGTVAVNEPLGASEKGGDMGGTIIPLQLGVVSTITTQHLGEKQTQLVQGTDSDNNLGPYSRP